jgi:hypothetical protein
MIRNLPLALALGLALALVLLLAACANQKAPADDSFADLQDEKSDAFSKKMKLVDTIAPNDGSHTTSYSSKPSYRAYKFTMPSQGPATISVTSKAGDPVTWLTDAKFKTLDKNDDQSDSSTDSLINDVLPAGDYYVIFRDYNWESHRFTVTVTAKFKPMATPKPVPTDCSSFTNFTACAEGVFDALAANDKAGDDSLAPSQMPSGVRTWYDAFAGKLSASNVHKFKYSAGGNDVYVIWFDLEESYWVYLLSSDGILIAYGTSGDGCCSENGWSDSVAPNDDPFTCKCGSTAADHCNYC